MAKSSTAVERSSPGQSRKLEQRAVPFVGLILMVPVAIATGGVLRWSIGDSYVGLALASSALAAATYGLAHFAFHLGKQRKRIVQLHVTVTVALTGGAEALTVAIGLPRWWVTTFAIGGVLVAASWSLHRIDALRQRPDQAEQPEDDLKKQLGIDGMRFRRPVHHYDEKGDLARIEVKANHAPGQTVDALQQAVPGLESLANAPRGRSRAVPGEGAAESTLNLIMKDVLKEVVPYRGPSAPGGCITEPLVTAVGEDQQMGLRYVAGGHDHAPNPSSTGWMGMTRTGKTMNAQIGAMEVMSRRNALFLWFDTVKGAQTVRPLRRGLHIIVASDNRADFKRGMRALKDLVRWRADRLGECGYRSWTPEAAADPRLRMTFVIAHFEEADELADIAPDDMVWLASKGLSAGVSCEFSLQRASAEGMPTGLRFNVGSWYCFGTGDDYSAGFALSEATIAAGAHPENWRQSKPGYHYFEGIGVDEARYPVVHKSMFATDEQMEAHAEEWGPRMMPLDAGSIAALGVWHEAAKADTQALIARWDAGPDGTPAASRITSTSANSRVTAADTDPDSDDEAALRAEIDEEIAEMRNSGEIPIFAEEDGRPDEAFAAIDPAKPIPAPAPGDELSWGDPSGKIPANDREQAVAAFVEALRQLAEDPTLRSKSDPQTSEIQVATLIDRYRFRTRPWFSAALTDAVDGSLPLPDGLVLSRADKPGHYRLRTVREPVGAGNTA